MGTSKLLSPILQFHLQKRTNKRFWEEKKFWEDIQMELIFLKTLMRVQYQKEREGVDHNVFKSSKKSKKDFGCDSNLDFPSSFKRKKDELDVIQSEDQ